MKTKNKPKKWIKTSSSYFWGNLSAWFMLSVLPFLGLVVLIGITLWLVGLSFRPEYKHLGLVIFAGCFGALYTAWWLSELLIDCFQHFVSKFWMTDEDHQALMVVHRKWCDDCDAAQAQGLPEPKRPY